MNKLTVNDIEVRVKLLQKPKILAQAELVILNQIEIKGWRISPSQHIHEKFQENIWIQPPSYRAGYKYKPIAYISDKNLYSQIEEKIYDAYHKKRSENADEVADQVDKYITGKWQGSIMSLFKKNNRVLLKLLVTHIGNYNYIGDLYSNFISSFKSKYICLLYRLQRIA